MGSGECTGRKARSFVKGTPRGPLRVPSLDELRKQQGEFPPAIRELFTREPATALDGMRSVVDNYFGDLDATQQTQLLSDVGYLGDSADWSNHVGRPYSNVGRLRSVAKREPFAIDPDVVDRGTQAHASTVDSLADFLRRKKIQPQQPKLDEPAFDLAWESDGCTFVAEIKSITAANEEKQLRLGLGQVLRYRQTLESRGVRAVPVLVPERRPGETAWIALCDSLGVRLVWPGVFGSLP